MQILGFGNNIAGQLAQDITAEQTTIQVANGEGAQFADCLSSNYQNERYPLEFYVKLTLTNTQQTAHEIVHLTSVANDVLTVIRGQEGTTRRGWELGDFIGNLPTRGSENAFIQIGHQQGGFFTSGTAGGTANALTLLLPTQFFKNNVDTWELNTPLVIYPTMENTGPCTLQVTLGTTTVGTFPLYKGERDELDAGDILEGVPLLCLFNKTDGYFSLINPSLIYDILGTAAYRDVATSRRDRNTSRIPLNNMVVGVNDGIARKTGGTVTDCNSLPVNSVSFIYSDATNSPGFGGTVLDIAGINNTYRVQICAQLNLSAPQFAFRIYDAGAGKQWSGWIRLYSPANVPSADTVGAVPVTRKVNGKLLNEDIDITSQDIFSGQVIQLGENDNLNDFQTPGLYANQRNSWATTANNYPANVAGSLVVLAAAYSGTNGVNPGVVQEYHHYNNSVHWTRTLYNTGWSAWGKVYDTNNKPTPFDIGAVPTTRRINNYPLTVDRTLTTQDIFATVNTNAGILLNVNLNDVKTPGMYRTNGVAFTTFENNYPLEKVNGALFVYQTNPNGTALRQVFIQDARGLEYWRLLYNGVWSIWYQTYDERYPPPREDTFPVGSPIPWPAATAPSGYLLMQGQKFDPDALPRLGAVYTSGTLPDMRGMVIKMPSVNTRNPLSIEQDQNKAHNHGITVNGTDLGNKYTTPTDLGTKATSGNGNHNHPYNEFVDGGQLHRFSLDDVWCGPRAVLTGDSGFHDHTVGIGSHQHIVGLGAHGHTASCANQGNAEVTVKNIAFNYIVRAL